MSDEAQTIYRLGLALGCVWGAWFLKVGSGVSDDSKADGIHDGGNGRTGSNRVLRGSLHRGASAMKEDNGNGQVIDFFAARDRISMRRWAVANGFGRVR